MNTPAGDALPSREEAEKALAKLIPYFTADAFKRLPHFSETGLPDHIRPHVISLEKGRGWQLIGWSERKGVPSKLLRFVPVEGYRVCAFRGEHTETQFWMAVSEHEFWHMARVKLKNSPVPADTQV